MPKLITLLNTILMQNMGAALAPENEQVPQSIDDDFQSVGNLLDLRDEELFNRKNPQRFSMHFWSCRNPMTCRE
jgi:UTP:GlnB (protein PII) uridylyltransferase